MFRFLCRGRRVPRLEWIQIEVTSRCQGSCLYCPHTAWRSGWLNGDLPAELFGTVLRQLRQGTTVHLQGWGEPLLHPEFEDLVRRAAEAGFAVTTTTNAVLLDTGRALRLADAGLRILGVSLAGTDPGVNDRLRVGTSLRHLLRTVESIAGELEGRRLDRPRLHAAFLLTRSGIADLPRAVRTLISAGVQGIVVSSLDFVPGDGLVGETLWDLDEAEGESLAVAIGDAERAALDGGIELVVQLATSSRRWRCPEGPDRSVFVGFDGQVFPCVFTGVPVAGSVRHWTPWGAIPFRRMPVGDLRAAEMGAIWKAPDTRAFRRAARGLHGAPERCRGCVKPLVERWEGNSGGDGSLVPELG